MKNQISVILLIIIIFQGLALCESWFGYVKTTGNSWSIYRHSSNITFELDQDIKGEVKSFEGPNGRDFTSYCSYFEEMDINDVRFKQRTAALEGNYSSSATIKTKSEVKPPVTLNILRLSDPDIYVIDYYENWPVRTSISKYLEYSGKGINEWDSSGDYRDFISTNQLYSTDLSKKFDITMNQTRMNITVLAMENGVLQAEAHPTMDLNYGLSLDATGISDIKYQQSSSDDLNGVPSDDYGNIMIDERYQGLLNMTMNIHMKSQQNKVTQNDTWLPCCNLDSSMALDEGIAHSAEEVFGSLGTGSMEVKR
jgi:hypothetical protein